MLRSSNPILSKQDAFTPAAPQQYNQNPYNQSPGRLPPVSWLPAGAGGVARRPDDL